MSKLKIVCIIVLLVTFKSVWGGWITRKIGTCPTVNLEGVEVADGRNDGINRVYVASAGGGIYEWTYSGGSWSYTTVHYDGGSWYLVSIGNGRNDGINRLYGGEGHVSAGDVIECTFSGGSWTKQNIELNIGNVLGLKLGDGRDDGVNRVYAGGQYIGLYEYSWTGSNWSKKVISTSLAGGIHDIGDGRNDGKNRIYSPDRMGPLYEFTWTGSSFSSLVINLPESWLCASAIGPGRNDDKNRVYVSAYGGHLYEVYYTGSWQTLDMTPAGPNKSRYGICVGRTRSDGKYRVYTTTQTGAVTEFSWTGSTWEDSVVDAVSGATACLDIGDGRNDDTVRIYATNWQNGGVYEITNTSPYCVEEGSMHDFSLQLEQNKPNPFTQKTVISVHGLGISGQKSEPRIQIYDLAGKLVCTLLIPNHQSPITRIVWDGRDFCGNRVPRGVYFYRLETKWFSISKKLAIL